MIKGECWNMLTSFLEEPKNQVVSLRFQFAPSVRAHRELQRGPNFSVIGRAVLELWTKRVWVLDTCQIIAVCRIYSDLHDSEVLGDFENFHKIFRIFGYKYLSSSPSLRIKFYSDG